MEIFEFGLPKILSQFQPNEDLPEGAERDFLEAAEIVGSSPRGACALLRLSVQKICQIARGGKQEDINESIAALVKKGLNSEIGAALDVVRVIGNEAVHPGTMDLKDDKETAEQLFELVNLIAETLISQPKRIAALRRKLPEKAQQAIDKRDK